nr:HD-GYP domain-containing protein [Candidatus Calescibacterium sp.]
MVTRRVRRVRIPVRRLEVGATIPFTLLDDNDRVLLFQGQTVTEQFLKRLQQRSLETVIAEIVEEVREETAKEDVSFETKAKTLSCLENTMEDLVKGRPVSLEPLEEHLTAMLEEIRAHDELVVPIIQLKRHDDYTFTHSLNVAVIALFIGRFMEFSREELVRLGLGALLHDLGKLMVPQEILKKPTSLSEAERRIVERHPLTAKRLLDGQKGVEDLVKFVPLEHHERLDGSGYPLHLGSQKIHPFARIVAVADVYEALTSNRPYRKALPFAEVIEYLMGNAGYKLDEKVVQIFVARLSPYQVGDVVRLSDGREAVVSRLNPVLPFRPYVQVRTSDGRGGFFVEEIDLARSLTLTIVEEISLKSRIILPS